MDGPPLKKQKTEDSQMVEVKNLLDQIQQDRSNLEIVKSLRDKIVHISPKDILDVIRHRIIPHALQSPYSQCELYRGDHNPEHIRNFIGNCEKIHF